MKFSSDDIANQTFQTRFRGYDRHQVHEFLEGLAREWDHLYDELNRLGHEHEERTQELKEYRRRERSLHDALEMAKQVSEEVRHQAERDAEVIVAEAELKAERILAGVENRLAELREEMMRVQQQRIRFEAELRSVLDSHMKMLDLLSEPEVIGQADEPPEEGVESVEDVTDDEIVSEGDEDIGPPPSPEKMHRPG